MGFIFEDICKQWFFEQAKRNMLPFFIGVPGRWWGTNPTTRTQEEIDIMAARKDDALFAECKWKDSDTDADVLNELRRKSELFHYKNVYLYIFAKKSFTRKLLAAARELESVTLVTLQEMVGSL
jgi:hypothetical protein